MRKFSKYSKCNKTPKKDIFKQIETYRQTDTHTDREKYRQTDGHTERQTERQTDRQNLVNLCVLQPQLSARI